MGPFPTGNPAARAVTFTAISLFQTHVSRIFFVAVLTACRAAPAGSQARFPPCAVTIGKLFDNTSPCPEVARNPWLSPREQSLVSLSWQVYAYGVAFHMTGDPAYLGYMKTGVDYIRAHAIDPAGGIFTLRDADGAWGPAREFRNPQELGYGLLGLAFYYYLTRDPEVLTGPWYILNNYYSRAHESAAVGPCR